MRPISTELDKVDINNNTPIIFNFQKQQQQQRQQEALPLKLIQPDELVIARSEGSLNQQNTKRDNGDSIKHHNTNDNESTLEIFSQPRSTSPDQFSLKLVNSNYFASPCHKENQTKNKTSRKKLTFSSANVLPNQYRKPVHKATYTINDNKFLTNTGNSLHNIKGTSETENNGTGRIAMDESHVSTSDNVCAESPLTSMSKNHGCIPKSERPIKDSMANNFNEDKSRLDQYVGSLQNNGLKTRSNKRSKRFHGTVITNKLKFCSVLLKIDEEFEDNYTPHKCSSCGMRFKYIGNLRSHFVIVHNARRSNDCNSISENIHFNFDIIKRKVQTRITTSQKDIFNVHNMFTTEASENEEAARHNNSTNALDMEKHLSLDRTELYYCYICNKLFKYLSNLETHTSSMHGNNKLNKTI